MSLPNWIRWLSYQPFVVKMIHFLRIHTPMRWVYYQMARPRDKLKKISLGRIEAQFNIKNYGELRYIESTFAKGYGDERIVLKRLIQTLQPGDVAYDIGASIGIHTIFIAKKIGENGRVFAFEPERQSYEALMTNINLNNLKNIIPIKVALGTEFDEAVLYCDGCFNLMNRGDNLGQKMKIVPGDFWVSNENLPIPKVVKIDVEGYEYYVIRGLSKTLQEKTCQMVCCEIHPTILPSDIKPQMVIDLLKSFGFARIETYSRGIKFHSFCYKG